MGFTFARPLKDRTRIGEAAAKDSKGTKAAVSCNSNSQLFKFAIDIYGKAKMIWSYQDVTAVSAAV